jgi:hypothetical protein
MNKEIMEKKELQALLDGLQPENITDDENQPLGRFGRLAMDYLHETDPQWFSTLKMQGILTTMMERVDEEARTKREQIMRKLLEQDPLPETDDILERTRHLNEKRGIAEEIVLNEVVYKLR